MAMAMASLRMACGVPPVFIPRASTSPLLCLAAQNQTTPPTSIAKSSPKRLHPWNEDVGYIIKLSVGSFAGAIAIKYGSVLLPGITRPDLLEALLMIGVPTMISVIMLMAVSIKQGGSRQP